VPDRIVSLSQPWLRPIVRGKAKAAVEFGAKLDISVCDGLTRLEYFSFDAYNEAQNLTEMIERYRARTGRYPERVLADKIYRNRENLSYCAARGIRLSGPALGRPRKDEVRDKKRDYQDQADRVEIEREFSLVKRKCGLRTIVTRLEETTCYCLAMSVLLLNLRKLHNRQIMHT
jgi:IS5 family transposase